MGYPAEICLIFERYVRSALWNSAQFICSQNTGHYSTSDKRLHTALTESVSLEASTTKGVHELCEMIFGYIAVHVY